MAGQSDAPPDADGMNADKLWAINSCGLDVETARRASAAPEHRSEYMASWLQLRQVGAKRQLEALGIGARALQPIPIRPADRALHRTARQFGRESCLLQCVEDVGLAHRLRGAAEIDIRHKGSRAAGNHRQAMIAELGRALPRETAAVRQTVLQARWRQRRPFDSRQRVEPAPIGIEVLTESDLHSFDQLLLRRGSVS
jgi:hypothetical protein